MSFPGAAKPTTEFHPSHSGRSAFPFAKSGTYQSRVTRVLTGGSILGPLFPSPATQLELGKQINSRSFLKQFYSLCRQNLRLRVGIPLAEGKSEKKHKRSRSKMPSSCKEIRAALAQCLQESDCVMVYRNKAADCLRPPLSDTLPTKCQQLKKGYGECKRGMVDMRKRFRGNQPIAVSKELEGGAENPSHQLYAGKPAFGTGVKATSGHEPEEPDWRELENEKYRKSQG